MEFTKKNINTIKYLSKYSDNIYTNDDNVVSDKRSLYVITGKSTYLEISNFCENMLDRIEAYLKRKNSDMPPLSRDYKINVVIMISKEKKNYAGWSVIYFIDPRVYNLLIGKDEYGNEIKFDKESPWNKTPPILEEQKKEQMLIPLCEMKCGDNSVVPVVSPYKINVPKNKQKSLISFDIPENVTEYEIIKMFSIYSTVNNYPKIRTIRSTKPGKIGMIIEFAKLEDMLFAKAMQMITYLKLKNGRRENIYTVKFNQLRKRK